MISDKKTLYHFQDSCIWQQKDSIWTSIPTDY